MTPQEGRLCAKNTGSKNTCPYGAPWAPWALADGPWPIGLGDPPVGVYFRARGRWASRTPPWGYISGPEADGAPWGYISGPEADGAPWAPWASGTPPWGYHLIGVDFWCDFGANMPLIWHPKTRKIASKIDPKRHKKMIDFGIDS